MVRTFTMRVSRNHAIIALAAIPALLAFRFVGAETTERSSEMASAFYVQRAASEEVLKDLQKATEGARSSVELIAAKAGVLRREVRAQPAAAASGPRYPFETLPIGENAKLTLEFAELVSNGEGRINTSQGLIFWKQRCFDVNADFVASINAPTPSQTAGTLKPTHLENAASQIRAELIHIAEERCRTIEKVWLTDIFLRQNRDLIEEVYITPDHPAVEITP